VTARLAFLAVLLIPRAALACATCASSAYGDRTFNWAFFGLILMPFVVGSGIAGVFAARYWTPREGYRRWPRRARAEADKPAPHEESTL
jgi:hypothetical protein